MSLRSSLLHLFPLLEKQYYFYKTFSHFPEHYSFLFETDCVFHIGAGKCNERFLYDLTKIKSVFWAEANPLEYTTCLKNIQTFPNQYVYNQAIGLEKKNVAFNIASNAGSSSFYELHDHRIAYPLISQSDTIYLDIISFDTFLNLVTNDHPGAFSDNQVNSIVMDVQGYELSALMSLSDPILQKFKYILLETSNYEAYKGQPLHAEIVSYLEQRDFVPARISKKGEHIHESSSRWFSDTLFLNTSLLLV